MTTSYDPNVTYDPSAAAGTSAGTAAAKMTYLPDGSMDLYGLGDMASRSIFTGVQNYQGYGGQYSYKQQTGEMPQYTAAYQLVQQFAKQSVTDPSSFSDMQSQMFNAGFYGSQANVRWGTWTAHDGDALTAALRGYLAVSQTGVPITFSEWLQKASTIGEAQSKAQQQPITLTDSTTLKADANQAGQADLGRNLSAGEQQAFASDFQGKERDAQLAKKAAVGPDGVKEVEMPSRYDAAQNATQYVQQNNNTEYQQKLQSDYMAKLNEMLGVK